MCGVGITVEEADGNPLDVKLPHPGHDASDLILRQWRFNRASVSRALVNGDHHLPGEQWRRAMAVEVPGRWQAQTSQLQHVPEAFSGEEGNPGTTSLDDGVDADSGAVDEIANLLEIN